MKNFICILFSILFSVNIEAQVAINTDGSNADPSAIVDIKSSSKGFLPPVMSKAKRDSIKNPAEGLIIYDSTSKSLDFYDGDKWISIEKTGVYSPDTSTFQLAIGLDKSDEAVAVVKGADGGYFIAGNTKTLTNNDSTDIFTVKITKNGNFDPYGTPYAFYYQGNNEKAEEIITVTPNNYLMLTTETDDNNKKEAYIYSFTSNGTPDQSFCTPPASSLCRFNKNDKLVFKSLIKTSDGHYVYAGQVDTVDNENTPDAYLLITDTTGNYVADRYIAGNGEDCFKQVIETSDGHLLAVGYTYIENGSAAYMLITQFDMSGNINHSFGNDGSVVFGLNGNYYYTLAQSVVETADGGYIVAGETNVAGAGGYDACFLKLQPDGNIDKNFGTGGVLLVGSSINETINKIIKTSDGNYLAVGYSYSCSWFLCSGDMYFVKITPQGTLYPGFGYNGSGTIAIGGTSDDSANDMIETDNGSLIAVGYTYSFGSGNKDMYVVKLNRDGITCSNMISAGNTTGYGGSVVSQSFNSGSLGYVTKNKLNTYVIKTAVTLSKICQ